MYVCIYYLNYIKMYTYTLSQNTKILAAFSAWYNYKQFYVFLYFLYFSQLVHNSFIVKGKHNKILRHRI